MKKVAIISFFAIFAISCNTNEGKIKTEIENYLCQNVAQPKNYEFLKFEIIDSINEGELFEHNLRSEEFGEDYYVTAVVSNDEYYRDSIFDLEINGKIKGYNKTKQSSKIISYIIKQKFRFKDDLGNLSIKEIEFAFDNDFNLLANDENEFLKISKIK